MTDYELLNWESTEGYDIIEALNELHDWLESPEGQAAAFAPLPPTVLIMTQDAYDRLIAEGYDPESGVLPSWLFSQLL